MSKRKNHKFDIFTDTCERCGVIKRRYPIVSTGYNMSVVNKFATEYSKDGINFSLDFINCNT